ncbi:hypothetical protein CSB45_13665 [candidate division KSB3 bacterium]|uniref:Uncharacterized protein n=1 Tax=candidate division KSB3 bacterium TaxID=2044937 RepID=A0A2G6E1P1_9BACT|nr:MAG: hypothetical protein CSB45_13665 [candidate division KSB3 bacterium]PIE28607.1 MAG: hypothetical protein CSA57_13315 [candidate division KSB3 bacterium]
MIQRHKNKSTQKNKLSVDTETTFDSLNSLKSEASITSPENQTNSDLDASTETLNKEENEFNTIKRLPEIKTTSTADYLNVRFVPVQNTFSGYFQATSKRGHQLEAILEDEANKTHPVLNYKGIGEIKTLIVPVGKVGDRAFFKVTDCLTGAEATGEAVTISLAQSFWKKFEGFIKSLFSVG